jgi:AbrB family looped-hinge helix DNA binding protein
MVELRVKVSKKGQILIPKIFRDKYGIEEGSPVMMEPTANGLLIKGRAQPAEALTKLKEHINKIRSMGIAGPNLGDLKKVYLEIEFEEKIA